MRDWLGTGRVADQLRVYRPFPEARTFARGLNLRSRSEWLAFSKGRMPHKGRLPTDIPANPAQTYAGEGWNGVGDWLGTGTIAPFLREYRPFGEARAFVWALGLKSRSEWRAFCSDALPAKGRLPMDIPRAPEQVYAGEGWNGFGDWLGTQTTATYLRVYRPFLDARAFVRTLNLRNQTEWRLFCKGKMPGKVAFPKDIPVACDRVYSEEGWAGFADWLGTTGAREFIQKIGARLTNLPFKGRSDK